MIVFLEGGDDFRFYEAILKQPLARNHTWLESYKYAEKTPKDVCRFLRNVQNMGADYIFFSDINSAPCIQARMEHLVEKYPDLDESKILIVRSEIESWYRAGLDRKSELELKLEHLSKTDQLTKELFNGTIPSPYSSSRIDFMQEILSRYSLPEAVTKNRSLAYYLNKYNCLPE